MKSIDSHLFFGLFSRASKKSRYRLLSKNGSSISACASIDRESTFGVNTKIYANVQINRSSIGKFTYIGPDSKIALTTIGCFCSIGRKVTIGLGLHPTNWLSTHPAFYSIGNQTTKTFSKSNKFIESKPVHIGHDVWIGANAIILDGVTIGNGAIIATGAVVTKDVSPYAIVAGVPAKELRKRFTNSIICELGDWEWWNLPDEKLSILAKQFTVTDDWSVADLKSAIGEVSQAVNFNKKELPNGK